MDGVIADFNKRYKELYKIEPKEADTYKTFDKFFTMFIAERQFATLDLMPDAMMLINYLRSLPIPTEILSSTALFARACASFEAARNKSPSISTSLNCSA